jgi:hypothetical protein
MLVRPIGNFLRGLLLLTLFFVLSIDLAHAQGARGGIIGVVADSSGAFVPAASVTAIRLDTGLERKTVTRSDGVFLFDLLDPGSYRVEVMVHGFKKMTREPIVVRVTETADLGTVTLEIGTTAESVTVTGQAQLLQTTNAATGKVFDTNMVNNLPLVTRNFTQLLMLQPGVVSEVPNGDALGNGTQGFSVAGAR